jgi:hypothetical protein
MKTSRISKIKSKRIFTIKKCKVSKAKAKKQNMAQLVLFISFMYATYMLLSERPEVSFQINFIFKTCKLRSFYEQEEILSLKVENWQSSDFKKIVLISWDNCSGQDCVRPLHGHQLPDPGPEQ